MFVYNRPEHARKTIDALLENECASEIELNIFSDGPKCEEDQDDVAKVRSYLKALSGFRHVNVIERDRNMGLAKSIISGITEVVDRSGRVIVLEDDMVTSPYFLRFMNDALELYSKDERVISIHGYIYPIKGNLPETFFLKGADCWGWATWKRGWDLFEPDGKELLKRLRYEKLDNEFDFNGAYPYTRMLEDQIIGRNDSWAVRWYASAFLQKRLTLYPGKSLVRNIGTDQSGTHCGDTTAYDTELTTKPIPVVPLPIEENRAARHEIEKYFKRSKGGLPARLREAVTSLFRLYTMK
jgi:hypothetical protein